jgi:hypothetical protein
MLKKKKNNDTATEEKEPYSSPFLGAGSSSKRNEKMDFLLLSHCSDHQPQTKTRGKKTWSGT